MLHVAIIPAAEGRSAGVQVCIVEIVRGSMRVKAHAWDDGVGGSDLDGALMRHFADELMAQTDVNVIDGSNLKSQVRMAKAVTKCRHLLTTSKEADMYVDALLGEHDFRCWPVPLGADRFHPPSPFCVCDRSPSCACDTMSRFKRDHT